MTIRVRIRTAKAVMPRPSREAKQREFRGSLEFLRRQIFGRILAPGSELNENSLLELAGKSSPPNVSLNGIASAVEQLVFDGAAIRDGGQIKVVYQDDKRQNTLVSARIISEATIVDSLCHSTVVDLNPARSINENLKVYTQSDQNEFMDRYAFDFVMQDLEFHLALADADRNPAARRLITEAYNALVIPLPNPLPLHEHAVAITREHDDVLKAIISKDRPAAIRSIYIHLSAAVGRWYSSVPRFIDKNLRDVLLEIANTPLTRLKSLVRSNDKSASHRRRRGKKTAT